MTEVHITSDGTGSTSYVSTAYGDLIQASEATIHIAANEINTVDLTLTMPSVDIKARPRTITFTCPCCGEQMSHNCQGAP